MPDVSLETTRRPLDYGTDQRNRRVRIAHVVLAAVLCVCIAGSWLLGRSARAQAQTLLYMKQAARHVEPGSTVVFESDPQAAARLIEAGTHHGLGTEGVAAIDEPDSLKIFRKTIDTQRFDAVGALVFLHELTTPSGMRRIVVVRYLPQYIDGRLNPDAGLVAHIFEPGGLFSGPKLVGESHSKLLVSADAPEPAVSDPDLAGADAPMVIDGHMGLASPVLQQAFDPWGRTGTSRWYAGQPDLDDSTHFTIDFELDGRQGTIDGFLMDDGRHVRMQARPTGDLGNGRTGGLQVNLPTRF